MITLVAFAFMKSHIHFKRMLLLMTYFYKLELLDNVNKLIDTDSVLVKSKLVVIDFPEINHFEYMMVLDLSFASPCPSLMKIGND